MAATKARMTATEAVMAEALLHSAWTSMTFSTANSWAEAKKARARTTKTKATSLFILLFGLDNKKEFPKKRFKGCNRNSR